MSRSKTEFEAGGTELGTSMVKLTRKPEYNRSIKEA